uniref:Uncharacterized protein n=1 Tax=Triticum urartu TaxID=4572 RepID=A0A8R7UVL6_TRIUA
MGSPYIGKIPAHPAAARDPRSFSSTSSAQSVHRSRSGMPGNKQEHKVVQCVERQQHLIPSGCPRKEDTGTLQWWSQYM